MSAAAYQAAEGAGAAPGADAGASAEGSSKKDDDVVDAEYKVVDDEKK